MCLLDWMINHNVVICVCVLIRLNVLINLLVDVADQFIKLSHFVTDIGRESEMINRIQILISWKKVDQNLHQELIHHP